jgi:hypothetical protein
MMDQVISPRNCGVMDRPNLIGESEHDNRQRSDQDN